MKTPAAAHAAVPSTDLYYLSVVSFPRTFYNALGKRAKQTSKETCRVAIFQAPDNRADHASGSIPIPAVANPANGETAVAGQKAATRWWQLFSDEVTRTWLDHRSPIDNQ
jgi:hypothetical protein